MFSGSQALGGRGVLDPGQGSGHLSFLLRIIVIAPVPGGSMLAHLEGCELDIRK